MWFSNRFSQIPQDEEEEEPAFWFSSKPIEESKNESMGMSKKPSSMSQKPVATAKKQEAQAPIQQSDPFQRELPQPGTIPSQFWGGQLLGRSQADPREMFVIDKWLDKKRKELETDEKIDLQEFLDNNYGEDERDLHAPEHYAEALAVKAKKKKDEDRRAQIEKFSEMAINGEDDEAKNQAKTVVRQFTLSETLRKKAERDWHDVSQIDDQELINSFVEYAWPEKMNAFMQWDNTLIEELGGAVVGEEKDWFIDNIMNSRGETTKNLGEIAQSDVWLWEKARQGFGEAWDYLGAPVGEVVSQAGWALMDGSQAVKNVYDQAPWRAQTAMKPFLQASLAPAEAKEALKTFASTAQGKKVLDYMAQKAQGIAQYSEENERTMKNLKPLLAVAEIALTVASAWSAQAGIQAGKATLKGAAKKWLQLAGKALYEWAGLDVVGWAKNLVKGAVTKPVEKSRLKNTFKNVDEMTETAVQNVSKQRFDEMHKVAQEASKDLANEDVMTNVAKRIESVTDEYITKQSKEVGKQLWEIRNKLTESGIKVDNTEITKSLDDLLSSPDYNMILKDGEVMAWKHGKLTGISDAESAQDILKLRQRAENIETPNDLEVFRKSLNNEYLGLKKTDSGRQLLKKMWDVREKMESQFMEITGDKYKGLRQKYGQLKNEEARASRLSTKNKVGMPWEKYDTTSKIKKLFSPDKGDVLDDFKRLQEKTGVDFISEAQTAKFLATQMWDQKALSLLDWVKELQGGIRDRFLNKAVERVGSKLIGTPIENARKLTPDISMMPKPKQAEVIGDISEIIKKIDDMSIWQKAKQAQIQEEIDLYMEGNKQTAKEIEGTKWLENVQSQYYKEQWKDFDAMYKADIEAGKTAKMDAFKNSPDHTKIEAGRPIAVGDMTPQGKVTKAYMSGKFRRYEIDGKPSQIDVSNVYRPKPKDVSFSDLWTKGKEYVDGGMWEIWMKAEDFDKLPTDLKKWLYDIAQRGTKGNMENVQAMTDARVEKAKQWKTKTSK